MHVKKKHSWMLQKLAAIWGYTIFGVLIELLRLQVSFFTMNNSSTLFWYLIVSSTVFITGLVCFTYA